MSIQSIDDDGFGCKLINVMTDFSLRQWNFLWRSVSVLVMLTPALERLFAVSLSVLPLEFYCQVCIGRFLVMFCFANGAWLKNLRKVFA